MTIKLVMFKLFCKLNMDFAFTTGRLTTINKIIFKLVTR